MGSVNDLVIAVVVAYNPDLVSLQENIRAVSPQVSKVYLWDNTGDDSPVADVELPWNVEYLKSVRNLGIAEPLNRVAMLAAASGAEWMLTLDQDSTVPRDYVSRVLDRVGSLNASGKVGIVAGTHETTNVSSQESPSKQVKTLITSGGLVYLPAYQAAGGCDDEFFIDCVDHELALKIRRMGWALWRLEDIRFSHTIGAPVEVHLPFLSAKFSCSNHSELRKYYATRNRFRLYARYLMFDPGFCFRDIYAMFAEAAKIVLFESGKIAKLRAMGLGVIDAVRGRGGQCTRPI